MSKSEHLGLTDEQANKLNQNPGFLRLLARLEPFLDAFVPGNSIESWGEHQKQFRGQFGDSLYYLRRPRRRSQFGLGPLANQYLNSATAAFLRPKSQEGSNPPVGFSNGTSEAFNFKRLAAPQKKAKPVGLHAQTLGSFRVQGV